MGDMVFGSHSHISKLNWCLIAEIYKEEAIDIPLRDILKRDIFISLVGVFVLTLVGFFIGSYLNKKGKK